MCKSLPVIAANNLIKNGIFTFNQSYMDFHLSRIHTQTADHRQTESSPALLMAKRSHYSRKLSIISADYGEKRKFIPNYLSLYIFLYMNIFSTISSREHHTRNKMKRSRLVRFKLSFHAISSRVKPQTC